jgi:hypothetical protein
VQRQALHTLITDKKIALEGALYVLEKEFDEAVYVLAQKIKAELPALEAELLELNKDLK